MSKKKKPSNLRLAGLFLLGLSFLILVSLIVKLAFIIKESKFDGTHRFIVAFASDTKTKVVSLSPQNSTISIVSAEKKLNKNQIVALMEIPVNAIINTKDNITEKNLAINILKTGFGFDESKNLNFFDSFRLFLFARSLPLNSIYERSFTNNLTNEQKSTLLSLSFNDPSIQSENLSIQIINASDVFGQGSRLASFINNIGGSVILVSSPQEALEKSEIIYSKKSYTVDFLSTYFGFPLRKNKTNQVADVIIVLGKDRIGEGKY